MSASAEGYVYIDSARLNIQPVNALLEEQERNPRSRSAKLRIAEKK
jgi:16S rRNA C1402 N4-methylase RsmH